MTRVTRCSLCGGALRQHSIILRPTEATDIVMLRCTGCGAVWNDERPRPRPRRPPREERAR
jgi:uncharacterized Zn finger protein